MKKESEYYGNVMRKYASRDQAEWIIGVSLCLLSLVFYPLSILLCGASFVGGISLIAYCSGKESVTMRMMKEEISPEEWNKRLLDQKKLW